MVAELGLYIRIPSVHSIHEVIPCCSPLSKLLCRPFANDEEKIEAQFMSIDKDGSGEIDFEEFKPWFETELGKEGSLTATLNASTKGQRDGAETGGAGAGAGGAGASAAADILRR